MDPDQTNNAFYNEHAGRFDKIPFEDLLPDRLKKYLPKKACAILEIGSGPGSLALWLSGLGHSVTCIEPASKPARLALERGLKVIQCRFQDFTDAGKYDGILAISSLIHIPKSEIAAQIGKIASLLQSDGVVFVSFIEGGGEGFEDPTNSGRARYFAKYSEEELLQLFSSHFTIIECHKIKNNKMNQSFCFYVLTLPKQ